MTRILKIMLYLCSSQINNKNMQDWIEFYEVRDYLVSQGVTFAIKHHYPTNTLSFTPLVITKPNRYWYVNGKRVAAGWIPTIQKHA